MRHQFSRRKQILVYIIFFKEDLSITMKLSHENGLKCCNHDLLPSALGCLATVVVAVWLIFFQLMYAHTYMHILNHTLRL